MSAGTSIVSTWAASRWRAVMAGPRATAARRGSPEITPGPVLVTGSSGKGTTCQMLASVLTTAGLLATKLIEVEPGSCAGIGRRTEPAAILCTNILCGQPDGSVDATAIAAHLDRAIRSVPASTTLILNADDPRVATLAAGRPNPRLFFGVADPLRGRVHKDPTADMPRCPRCAGQLSYSCTYYAHLGHWSCPSCGLRRPEPDVSIASITRTGALSSRIQLATNDGDTELEVPLPGLYNAYNALAALTVAVYLRLPTWSLRCISDMPTVPMRMERVRVAGHDVHLAVAANASGYTEVLRAILGNGEPRRMLLGLGHEWSRADCSWIWDVDFESVAGLVPAPVVSGNRAADLAVRLKYAGWFGSGQDQGRSAGACIQPDPVRAVWAALAATPPGEPLWIVSTATALADIRRWLQRYDVRGQQRAFSGESRAGRRTMIRPAGPQPAGPQPAGPQPTGPARAAPQPTAPPARRKPERRGHWRAHGRPQSERPGQSGAAR